MFDNNSILSTKAKLKKKNLFKLPKVVKLTHQYVQSILKSGEKNAQFCY